MEYLSSELNPFLLFLSVVIKAWEISITQCQKGGPACQTSCPEYRCELFLLSEGERDINLSDTKTIYLHNLVAVHKKLKANVLSTLCVCRNLSMRWKWPTSLPAGDIELMFMTSFLSLCLRDVPHPPQSHRASMLNSACSAHWSHGTGTLPTAAWHAYFIKNSRWILCVHQDTASPSCSVAYQSKEWRREDKLGVWQANRTCQPASSELLNYIFNLIPI